MSNRVSGKSRPVISYIRTTVLTAALSLAALPVFAQQPPYHANDVTPVGATSGKLNSATNGKQAGARSTNGTSHAVVMSGNALAAVDLHPANYYSSAALASDDTQQAGWALGPSGTIHKIGRAHV